jgi:hypothetical protein
LKNYQIFYNSIWFGEVSAVNYKDAYELSINKTKKILGKNDEFDLNLLRISDDPLSLFQLNKSASICKPPKRKRNRCRK